MMKAVVFFCLIIPFFLGSCQENTKIENVLTEWLGKEILYPQGTAIIVWNGTNFAKEQIKYKVFVYTDSSGCLSCKLNLTGWKRFILLTDSVASEEVQFLFVFQPIRLNELKMLLKSESFSYPIFVDMDGNFNKLNHFPSDINYQTFLLDKDNKVLAIGNPVLNPKVKDLYLRIIRGESPQAPSDAGTPVTTVSVSSTEADLGTFPWQEPRTCTFTLRNTGDRPLVIHDVTTSCGCLTVDYPEEPARPGEELTLRAHYRADSRGTVLKSMQVYCNAQGSPLRLRVTGTAE